MTLKRIHIDKNVKLCEKLVLYFYEKVQKIAAFAMFFFWCSVTKQLLETDFGYPQLSEIPTLPASLKM